MVPKRCDKNVYIRHEKNNCCTVDSSEYGLKMLNSTATFVFDHCDGNNSLDDIIRLMQKKYPDVDKEQLTSDVKEILYYLKDLKLLQFENEKEPSGVIFKTASDYDFGEMKKFILANKNRDDVFIYEKSPVFYREHLLRSRQFSLNELSYICKVENEIKHLITINQIDMLTGTTKITVFICDVNEEHFESFFNYVLNDLKRFNVNKIEFHQIESLTKFDLYNSLGFVEEAVLKKEYKGQDITIFSCFIS
ncbi:MAG: PqqD family protein [Lachnospiraceae bacterium]